MDLSKYCDLLIVTCNETLHIVEVPDHEANVGNLVEFENEQGAMVLGEVVDKFWCGKESDTYRCMTHLHTICSAKRVYYPSWTAPAEEQ